MQGVPGATLGVPYSDMAAPMASRPANAIPCEPSRRPPIRTTTWRPPLADPFPKPEGGAATVKQRPFPDIQLSQTGEWLWRGAGGGGGRGPALVARGGGGASGGSSASCCPGKALPLAGEGQDGSQQDHPGAEGHHRPQAARRRRERAQPGKGGPAGGPPHARHGGVRPRRRGRGASPAPRRERSPAAGPRAGGRHGRVAALAR